MRYKSEGGYALVWITVVVLGVMILGLGLLQLGQAQGSEVVKEVWYAKALNLAEGGLDRCLWKLKTDPTWVAGWSNVSCGDGTYAVTVTPTGQPNEVTINSTGTVGSIAKTVTMAAIAKTDTGWPWVFDYALFWDNPTGSTIPLNLDNNSNIQGSAFAYGSMNLDNNAEVEGLTYATGGVTGTGTWQNGTLPDPLPTRPVIDTSPYTTMINTANSVTAAIDNMPAFFTWNAGTSTYTLLTTGTHNMGGGIHYSKGSLDIENDLSLINVGEIYVHGNVTIKNGADLTGPGKIVCSGFINVDNNCHITEGIDLIAGGQIAVKNNGSSVEGEGSVVYSPVGVEFANNASMDRIVVITTGYLNINNNDVINGLLWGGIVNLENNAIIRGACYADMYYNNRVDNCVTIIHDESMFSLPPPEGIPQDPPEVTVTVENWSEGSTIGM